MSTAQKCRYLLAAGALFVGIGFWMEGVVLTGIFFLVVAVLLLPILYQLLYIELIEVQLLSPIVFVIVGVFSFYMYNVTPKAYTIPPIEVYNDVVQTTTTSITTTSVTSISTVTVSITHSTSATTDTQTESVENTVYRTPSGKRYHYNAECGGENSFEVSIEDAVEAGLTPCKKCAGG